MPWTPTRIAPTGGYHPASERARENAAPDVPPLDEAGALKELVSLFDFHALGVKIMSGPYAKMSDPVVPCTRIVNAEKCGLAVRKGKSACAFHDNVGHFAAAGYGADDIHAGARAEAEIRARFAGLKL